MAAYGTLGRVDLLAAYDATNYGARWETSQNPPSSSSIARRGGRVFDKIDSSKDVQICFDYIIPSQYSGTTGLKFLLTWEVDGLSTGNVVWGVKAEKITTNSTSFYTDNFGTATTATTAVPTVANGYTQTTISVVLARLGTPTASDVVRVCLYRACTSASDTFSGAARVVAVEVIDY